MNTLLLLLIPMFAFSQVGVGTTSPEETLHVAGTARIDTLPEMINSNKIIVSDSVGKLGYKLLDIDGVSFENDISIATNNVLLFPNTQGQYVRNDVDLNLEITVTVAPNTTSIIRVEYSLPLGAQNCLVPGMDMLTYIGATFYRDGVEIREANRKIQLDPRPWAMISGSTGSLCSMGFITCSYTETVVNTGNTTINISYEIMGYIEQHYVSSVIPYIYNMWLPFTGANYNWGDAFIKYQKITF